MATQEFVRLTKGQPQGAAIEDRLENRGVPRYRRPQLSPIGTVVELVQSGPIGNRDETYQGRYWSDR